MYGQSDAAGLAVADAAETPGGGAGPRPDMLGG